MSDPIILAIDTSCDETSVAVTCGRCILANEMYSQILVHKKWGGVVPNLAKRAHEERIDGVIETALKKSKKAFEDIDYIAVTYGPGLAIALGVGINKAKDLSLKYQKKLIAVNHMEGHIYSCFAQNSKGNPNTPILFPYIALLVSGGHTELVLFKNHISYEIIGETLDDAAGEALDKAARMILDAHVYPGGPVIEELAKKGNPNFIRFPRPLEKSKDLNFSYSGLKTSLYNYLKSESINRQSGQKAYDKHHIAASFQEAVIDSLLIKLEKAVITYKIRNVLIAGGVVANMSLRKKARVLVKTHNGKVIFPPYKSLYGDNAAMIGIAAYYKAKKGMFAQSFNDVERQARAQLV